MSKFSTTIVFLISTLVLFSACNDQDEGAASTPTTPPVASAEQVIVLGDISDDPGEVIEGTQPLADYIAAGLSEFGITEGRVKIAATADEMIQLLENGEVDIYFDSVYPATLIGDASGGQTFLRRWRYGVEEYYSVIFAHADSGITSVEDSARQMIAMDNPLSTSGYFMPSVYLIDHDLNLVGKASYGDSVADDEVGIVFSYDDENTLQWVLSGLVSAGATDDYNFEVALPAEVRDSLVVVGQTESVPRQVAVARPDLDADLLAAIKQILIGAHEDEAGQVALDAFQTSRFDDFPEGIEAAQDQMRAMMEQVQAIPLP